LKPITRFKI